MTDISEWSPIDVFVGGVGVGLLIGALFAYWAIRAFREGVNHGFERRLREDERTDERQAKVDEGFGIFLKCQSCCWMAGQSVGSAGPPPCECRCHPGLESDRRTPPPPADEDPGKVVKSG